MSRFGLVAALLFSACLVAALPASYQCTPGGSTVCASNSPPGGLKPSETPQFILISHDDAITVTTNNAVRAIVNPFKNPGGCNVPVTFFVSGGSGSNCAIVKRLQGDNHEIATHTLSHVSLSPSLDIKGQISQQRDWLHQTCGLALDSLRGFRAPYLLHNPQSRQALQELGFAYDSSIIESWPSATSPSSASRLWPYSMASGIPQNCQARCRRGAAAERYSGLFEVPLQQFLTGPVANGIARALSTMDPTADTEAALLAQLREQFAFSYGGNRAPLTIALHTPWFAAKPHHSSALATFINETLAAHSDVYFVTFFQLVRWMEAPVKASAMRSWLSCNAVDFAAAQRAKCSVYTVKAGDTISAILAEQQLELAELQAANPSLATSAAVYIGQRLFLPPWDASCPSDPLASLPPCRNVTVKPGDSLYALALSSNLTVADIVKVNAGLTPTSTLSIGQQLRLPPWPVECLYGNLTVVPAPAPSPVPATPAPAADCGSEVLELTLQLTGFDEASFDARLPQFTAGLAALVRVQAPCITVTRTTSAAAPAGGQRRRLSATAPLLAVVSIRSANATRVAGYLAGAQQLGSLQTMMGLLGGQVEKVSFSALSDQGTVIVPPTPLPTASPSPAPAPSAASPAPATPAASPSPAPSIPATTASGSASKPNHTGAIVGGVVGGFFGAMALAGIAIYIARRRRAAGGGAAAPGQGGLRTLWTHNPLAGATAAISTGRGGSKAGAELAEVVEQTGTPSSARRRGAPTPFA